MAESKASQVATPTWAQGVVQRTAALWQRLEGQYPFWQSGFAVFYSPVKDQAKVVVLGANPGGGPTDFRLRTAAAIPAMHDYFAYDYQLAQKMRELFAKAGKTDLLRQSIKLNLNFFRSKDQAEWKKAPLTARKEMQSHSSREVQDILRRLKPAIVLTEGAATFDALRTILKSVEPSEVVVQSPGGRAYMRAKSPWGGLLIGVIHPTGAQYSSATWRAVTAALTNDLVGV